MAFGHLAGAINNFLYWVTNPVWLGGTLAIRASRALQVFFNDGNAFCTPVVLVDLAGLHLDRGRSPRSSRSSVGKWLPTAGAFARFLLLGLFTVSVVIYATKHGVHGLGAGYFTPTAGGFVALVGVLLFNYVGFELPNSAGEEMTRPAARRAVRDRPLRRSPRFLLYAGAGPRHPARAARPARDELQRVRRRDEERLHRVRRPRRRATARPR